LFFLIRELNLRNYKDPQIEIIDGEEKYLDIVNNKPRPANPEELVRQKFIKFMHKKLDIPYEAMLTEENLKHYISNNVDRMDICVKRQTNNGEKIVMVVECKAPEVALTEEVYDQAKRYAEPLNIPVLVVTNGIEYDCIMRNPDNTYEDITKLPTYEELERYEDIKTVAIEEYDYKRWNFDELYRNDVLKIEYNLGNHITDLINKEKASNCLNLAECFLDTSHEIEELPLKNYTFVKDEGIYSKKAGNPIFDFVTNYRLVKIKDKNDNCKNVGFAIVTDPYPALFVGTYYKHTFHNALELNLHYYMDSNDDNLHFIHNYNIYHNKSADFRDYVKELGIFEEDDDKHIVLGDVDASKLLFCDNPEVENLMANLIEYSILRDEFRILKENEKKNNDGE